MTIRWWIRPLAGAGMVICALTTGAWGQDRVVPVADSASTVEPHVVSVADVRTRIEAGATILFLDTRAGAQTEMIRGAAHVPLTEAEAWARDRSRDTIVVTYCACASEGGSKAVARRLLELGFTNVAALKGGIGAWKAAGLAVEVPGAH